MFTTLTWDCATVFWFYVMEFMYFELFQTLMRILDKYSEKNKIITTDLQAQQTNHQIKLNVIS